MTQEEHVLAEEEQMTAERTEQHAKEQHTGLRTERKTRKRWQQARQCNFP